MSTRVALRLRMLCASRPSLLFISVLFTGCSPLSVTIEPDAGLCASFIAPCSSNFDCRNGEECLPPLEPGCFPSACGPCDSATGTAACTKDCNGRRCRARPAPDAGANRCAGFEAPCLSDTQCGPGRVCRRDPSQCTPSACTCDAATGAIRCTKDCGGGVCAPPPADGGASDGGACVGFREPCVNDTDCLSGETCDRPAGACLPSGCACGPGGISCTDDCGGGVCRRRDAGVGDAGASDGGFCIGFVPPCSTDAQCGPGNRCVRDSNQCNPSACGCDPATGSIICTADCGGGLCAPIVDAGVPNTVADAGLCANFDPPCSSDAQCAPGTTCRRPQLACAPTACGCDPSSGNITCTADCGGRRCLP